MTTKAVYVLETVWAWDNTNVEYATITVEEPEDGFEEMINPDVHPMRREVFVNKLKEIANAQNGSPLGESSMACLYRVSWPDGYKHVIKNPSDTDAVELSIRMEPICGFDADGNPVPIDESAHNIGKYTRYKKF